MERFVKVCRMRRVKILVLLHVMVVNAAAQCQKPQATEIHVLSQMALLMNHFPEGTEVTLECSRGYEKDSGSGTIVCTSGKWSKPDLNCKKFDCGMPKPEPNMIFNISQGTRFGAVLGVSCNKGYQLSGSSYKNCFAKGWIGRTRCTIITCDKPGTVANGMNLWNSEDRPKYGETIEYRCDGGYTLVGKENIVCTETGKYDSHPPECRGVTNESHGITAVMVTSTSLAAGTLTDSSANTATTHGGKTITTRAPTVLYSTQGTDRTFKDSRNLIKAAGEGTTASVTSTFEDLNTRIVDTNKGTGLMATVGVLCCALVAVTIGLFAYKFLLRKKGSYDTREDMKPEVAQFQNL